jgi:hypothetical protein
LRIWEKYKGNRQLEFFDMIDDIDAPEADFGARGVDLEGGANSVDVRELAVVDHESMYFLICKWTLTLQYSMVAKKFDTDQRDPKEVWPNLSR